MIRVDVCAGCGQRFSQERKRGRPRVLCSQIELEPFCSTQCCRRWHGCELASEGTEAQVEAGREQADVFRALAEVAIF